MISTLEWLENNTGKSVVVLMGPKLSDDGRRREIRREQIERKDSGPLPVVVVVVVNV